MAFFGNQKKSEAEEKQSTQEEKKKETPHVRKKVVSSAVTIITEGSSFVGTINGIDSLHIDGRVEGDIVVDNGIIIGKSGRVKGNIEAKKVVVSGKLDGSIVCEKLEVMKNGGVYDSIEAIDIILDGEIKGDIFAQKSIDIMNNAKVESQEVSTDSLKIDGTLYSNQLTTRFLEITPKGFLDSDMQVDIIKIHKGGTFTGSIERLVQEEVAEEEVVDERAEVEDDTL